MTAVSISVIPSSHIASSSAHLNNGHNSNDSAIALKRNSLGLNKENISPTQLATPQNIQNRRRSYSGFTFHSNYSFDNNNNNNNTSNNNTSNSNNNQHKRHSFSSKRRSFTNSNINSNSNLNSIPKNSHSNNYNNNNNKNKNTRFFSSPQFSSSTPNLSTKYYKNIDDELKISNTNVEINGINLIIPTVVYKCCDFIKNNQKLEGLFRMNGSIKQVNLIENNLNKNISNYNFNSDKNTSIHDVAVILKRWISKLDDGLFPLNVCNDLISIQKDLMLSDIPSDDESLIDMNKNLDFSPTKSLHDDISIMLPESNNILINNSNTKLSPFSVALTKLPIETLHLSLYLLNFLNYLSKPEISNLTKMHTSNLAKVFQLNFFKSIDLTIGSKSFSTEDLKNSYLINEELLISLINDSDLILKDLSIFLNENQHRMDRLLKNYNPISNNKINDLNNLNDFNDDNEVIFKVSEQTSKRDSYRRRSFFGFLNKRKSSIITDDINIKNQSRKNSIDYNESLIPTSNSNSNSNSNKNSNKNNNNNTNTNTKNNINNSNNTDTNTNTNNILNLPQNNYSNDQVIKILNNKVSKESILSKSGSFGSIEESNEELQEDDDQSSDDDNGNENENENENENGNNEDIKSATSTEIKQKLKQLHLDIDNSKSVKIQNDNGMESEKTKNNHIHTHTHTHKHKHNNGMKASDEGNTKNNDPNLSTTAVASNETIKEYKNGKRTDNNDSNLTSTSNVHSSTSVGATPPANANSNNGASHNTKSSTQSKKRFTFFKRLLS